MKQIKKSSKYNTVIVNGIVCKIEVKVQKLLPSPPQIFNSLDGITKSTKHSLLSAPTETYSEPIIFFNMDNLPPSKNVTLSSLPANLPALTSHIEKSFKYNNISKINKSTCKKESDEFKKVAMPLIPTYYTQSMCLECCRNLSISLNIPCNHVIYCNFCIQEKTMCPRCFGAILQIVSLQTP